MKILMPFRWLGVQCALGVALSAVVALAGACEATVETGPNTPLIPDSRVKVKIDPNAHPPTCQLPSQGQGGTLPAGSCIRMTWYDDHGNPIGTTDLTAGGSPAPIPDGAAGASFALKDPESSPKTRRSDLSAQLVAGQPLLREFCFAYFPVQLGSDLRGQYVHYAIRARTFEEALVTSDLFIRNLLQAPPPAAVEVRSACDVELLPDGSLRVSMCSREAPAELAFTWNGQMLFDLGQASVLAANGWYAATVTVPSQLVNVSTTMPTNNRMEYELIAGARDVGGFTEIQVAP